MSRFPLEPLSIGQILDRVFRLYRANFLTFLGIVAIIQVPVVAVNGLLSLLQVQLQQPPELITSPEMMSGFLLTSFGALFLTIAVSLLSYFSVAALARATMLRYLGEPVTILEAYRGIGREWIQIILVMLLFFILAFALGIVGLLTCSLLGVSLFLAIVLELAIPIIVIERRSALSALRRGWDLVRRRFWWVLGFYMVIYLLQALIVTGPGTLAQLLLTSVLTDDPFSTSTMAIVAQSAISGLLGVLFLPLRYTASVLLYFDLRVRTEGLDLALRSATADDVTLSPAVVIGQAPAPEQGGLITMQEYLWMVGITIAGVFLLVLLSLLLSALFLTAGL